mgnify:CR=1 FL=1
MARVFKLKPDYIPEQFGGIYFLISKSNGVIKYIGMSKFDVHQRLRNYNLDRLNCHVKILRVKDIHKIRWIQKYRPSWNVRIYSKRTNYLHNPYN